MNADQTIEFLDKIRGFVNSLEPVDRVEFFHSIMLGYCEHCGRELKQHPNGLIQYCYCTRDE